MDFPLSLWISEKSNGLLSSSETQRVEERELTPCGIGDSEPSFLVV